VKELVSPPWLWLFGACGAGKTATGFELYRQLGAEGRRAGFIELDQVGMCLPDDDPIRAPIKTENLVAALGNFHAVRAEGVIVSGDLAGPPMRQLLERCGARQPALVRLHASPRESERRLRRRGAPPEYIEWSHSYDTHSGRDADVTIDTSRLTVAEAAARVRSELPAWPPPADRRHDHCDRSIEPSGDPGQAVLICGATPVGKSTVGWQVFLRSLADNVSTAYLDLAQIGWLHATADQHAVVELKSRNLITMWRNFARQGAERLIISGALHCARDLECYRAALPAVDIRVYNLTAATSSLIRRALLRGEGRATELPGDDLRDQPREQLEQLAIAASGNASAAQYPATVTSVDTDNREPEAIADDIAASAFTSRRP
jgi:hypothetical protein